VIQLLHTGLSLDLVVPRLNYTINPASTTDGSPGRGPGVIPEYEIRPSKRRRAAVNLVDHDMDAHCAVCSPMTRSTSTLQHSQTRRIRTAVGFTECISAEP
jgi:hypothetical protein